MSLSNDELLKDNVKKRMNTLTSDIDKIIGNYLYSTSKFIDFKTKDPYKNTSEDNEFTTNDFEFIKPNQLPSHNDFLSTPNDDDLFKRCMTN